MSNQDKLTPAQEKELQRWVEEGIKITLNTDRADRPRAEAAIRKIYNFNGQKGDSLEFYWFDSPLAAAEAIKESTGRDPRNEYCFWGSAEYFWQSVYAFARDVLSVEYKPEHSQELDAWIEVSKSCGWWWPYDGAVVCCERPVAINFFDMKENPLRLHSLNDFALKFSDDTGICSVRGTLVPPKVIFRPEEITKEEITSERNAEVRRVMLERFGYGRYIEEIGAKVLHQDVDPLGQKRFLLQAEIEDDEPLTMLKVINSSPEPDGSYKTYILRVDPRCTSVTQALGWTVWQDAVFGKNPPVYAPEIES